MVIARQKNFRAFIFMQGDAQETITYIEKNFVLLKDFLMIFAYPVKTADSTSLYDYLLFKNLNFIESPEIKKGETLGQIHLGLENPQTLSAIPPNNHSSIDSNAESQTTKDEAKPTLVFHRTIRSGEEIITQGDLTIFGRINSGAHIQSEGNIQIFGSISGNVFCNGDYMILGKVVEGNVLFHGEILDKERLQHNQNKIYKKQNEIMIEELQ
ncbi:septum site-determining protein MinC [Helicobacter sp.]|uniref:septum site-determining protein MinC n=1 Tax=Helicobacter sp. TaxID=218 RepID=UPI0019BC885C|nr:septum site-determining protein MinC [Helicobacter sp.]MBD5165907.1 septum site-determining protein MinC [Helicobacter sp.]